MGAAMIAGLAADFVEHLPIISRGVIEVDYRIGEGAKLIADEHVIARLLGKLLQDQGRGRRPLGTGEPARRP